MNHRTKPYLFATGITAAVFCLINLFGFLIHWLPYERTEAWTVRFRHGTLFLNDVATGMVWGDLSTSITLSVVFVISVLILRMKLVD